MYEKVIFSYVQGYLKFAMGDSGGSKLCKSLWKYLNCLRILDYIKII